MPPNWCKISPRINRKLALACPCGTPLQPSSPWLEAPPITRPIFFERDIPGSPPGSFFSFIHLNISNLEPGPVLLTPLTPDPDSSASLVERFPLKLCHLTLDFFGSCSNVLDSTNATCSFFSWKQFLSTSGLHDPDADRLLNTLLCMFYECDDYGASTSEPVVCHWSQRMCPLSGSYLSVTLSRLKLFSFSPSI